MSQPIRLTILGILCLLLAACRQPVLGKKSISTGNPYPINDGVLSKLKNPIFANFLASLLSPDGRRLITSVGLSATTPLEIISTETLNVEYKLTYQSSGITIALPIWSPDSKSIAIQVQTNDGRCSDRVLINQLGNQSELVPAEYHLPNVICGTPPLFLTWSPDSKNLAIATSEGNVYLLDQQANSTKVISIQTLQGQLFDIWWFSSGIFEVWRTDQSAPYKLILVDPLQKAQEKLVFSTDSAFYLAGFNKKLAQLFIAEDTTRSESVYRSRFSVLDIRTGKISWAQDYAGSRIAWESSSTAVPPNFVAIEMKDQDTKQNDIWILDWRNLDFEVHKNVSNLIGWRAVSKGFLALEGDESESVHIALIRP